MAVDEARSRNMAAIRSKDTRPEMAVRRALHAAGFRFRLHRKDLPGNPDLVLPKYRTAVFVHGCFWHGHGCADGHLPKTNQEYWIPKLAKTASRDRSAQSMLSEMGYRVEVIFECELSGGIEHALDGLIAKSKSLPQGVPSSRGS